MNYYFKYMFNDYIYDNDVIKKDLRCQMSALTLWGPEYDTGSLDHRGVLQIIFH